MTGTYAEEGPADEIDEAFVPRRHGGVSYVELDDELVVAVERAERHTFDAHWLDRRAALIWSAFDGTVALGQIIDELSIAFDTDRDAIRDDVLDLARTLGRAGLLEGVAFEPPRPPVPVRPEGIPIGTPVPPFALPDLDGNIVTSDDTRGRRHVLVNWSPSCGYCARIAPDLAGLLPSLRANGVDLLFVATGPVGDNRRVVDDAGLDCTVLQRMDFDLFNGLGTPTAYLVDERGSIASELVIGAGEVPDLLRQLAADP